MTSASWRSHRLGLVFEPMNASILFRILATTAVAWRIAERKPNTAKVAKK